MKMISAKKLAAKYLKVGTTKVWVDQSKLKEIKEAITGEDIKKLIGEGAFKKQLQGQSRGRARELLKKKQAGRKKGPGTRKGTAKARIKPKEQWLKKVRSQRVFIKTLLDEEKVDNKGYRDLYRKVKGGFFRSKAHISTYINKSK
jgi:large subunit ribosomal protein L19e